MLKKLLTLVAFVSTLGINAQSVTTSNETSAGACDGYAILHDSLSYTSWDWVDSTIIQSYGGEVYNLCAGSYVLNYTDSSGTNSYTFIIGTDTTNTCNGFAATSTSTNETGDSLCDGTATVTASGGTAPYTYSWNNGTTTSTIASLCNGSYTVTVTDANACSATANVYVYSDSTSTPTALYGYVSTTDESTGSACDGTANVIVFGGSAPFTYYHSSGTTTSTAIGLCAGAQTVLVTDAIGDSLMLNYLISTPSNTSTNTPYQDSTAIDTVGNGLLENCVIDYASVDSAMIDFYNFFSADTVTITWAVYDANGVTYFTETYYVGGGNGVYTIELTVNCSQKGLNDFLKATDQIYYNTSLVSGVGMDEVSNEKELNVYPNPFNDQVTISLEEINTYDVTVVDINGRIILSQSFFSTNNINLNLNDLAKGQYVLQIRNDQTTINKLIIK